MNDSGGMYWEPIHVWSTWQTFDTEQEAFDAKLDFLNSGVMASIVLQEDYDRFCLTHKIC